MLEYNQEVGMLNDWLLRRVKAVEQNSVDVDWSGEILDTCTINTCFAA